MGYYNTENAKSNRFRRQFEIILSMMPKKASGTRWYGELDARTDLEPGLNNVDGGQ
jgi:hypothetical protein